MDFYVIDKEYVNYLRRFDEKVGYVNYGDRMKMHIGILFKHSGYDYYVPVSSAKPKHYKMKNSDDFHKIIHRETGAFYAVLNFNNMIPVPETYVTKLMYNEVANYRKFASEKEKTDYIYLPLDECKSRTTLKSQTTKYAKIRIK